MFKVIFYGVGDKGFGALRAEKIIDINLNELELDDIAFFVVEDATTHMKRFIFSMTYRSRLMKNNVNGLYKSVTFFGRDGMKSWVQIINYSDAEIFCGSPVHVFQMLELIANATREGMPFWSINNLVKEYAEKYGIKCFTGVAVE